MREFFKKKPTFKLKQEEFKALPEGNTPWYRQYLFWPAQSMLLGAQRFVMAGAWKIFYANTRDKMSRLIFRTQDSQKQSYFKNFINDA